MNSLSKQARSAKRCGGIFVAALAALALCGCPGEGKGNDTELPSIPADTGIRDVWEYDNPDGACSAGEVFGDNPTGAKLGCLHFAEVVRFRDGSAYFEVIVGNAGAGIEETWSAFVRAGTAAPYANELHLGSNLRYSVLLDLRPAVPVLTLDFDQDLSYANGAALSATLTAVGL